MTKKQVAFLVAVGVMAAVFGYAQTGGSICIQENGVNKGCVQYLNFEGDTASYTSRNVAFIGISDAGVAFARYAADAGNANTANYALDAGQANYAPQAGVANYADDAGFSDLSNYANAAGSANTADVANYALDAGQAAYAPQAGVANYAHDAGSAANADFARDAGSAAVCDFARDAGSAAVADFARDAGSAASADVATFATSAGSAGTAATAAYALDAGNVVCTGCIISDRIAVNAVTKLKILAGEIDHTRIADGGILGGNIILGGIGTPQLAINSVTNTIIGPSAITTDKIDAGAVTEALLAPLSVSAAKIQDTAVTKVYRGTTVTNVTDLYNSVSDTLDLVKDGSSFGRIAKSQLDAGVVIRSVAADLSVFALDAGLAAKAAVSDFARDAGSAASADVSTFALDAGRAVFATFAADAGLSAKAIAADFARDAGSAANADFARDAGSAASADLSTFALDAGRAVFAGFAADAGLSVAALYAGDAGLSVAALFAADAGNLQCTTCVDATDIATAAVTTPKLDNGSTIMAWDEGRGSLLAGRVTFTANGTMASPEVNQGYTSWGVTSGATDFYVETDIQFRTIKDRHASITYRTGGTTGWAASSTMRLYNIANTGQSATATMYGDGNWHTAIFDISAFTGTGTIRFDPQDLGAAIGAGATFLVSNVAVGNLGVGPGGGHTLSNYQGFVGINIAKPSALLHVASPTTTAPSLTWNAAAGQILRSENSELAIGLSNSSPFPLYFQGRTNTSTARNLSFQPLGGNVGIGNADPGYKLDIIGTTLASASASESALHRLFAFSSNGDQVITRLRRRFFGTAWDSADWQMFRRVDSTDMGGIQFNNTQGVDLTTGGTARLSMSSTALTTSVASHEIGPVSDTATFIDLHGAAATYTDYTLRIARNAGTNSSSEILHRGTGELTISAQENAQLALRTQATNRLTISGAGVVTVANLAGGGTRGVSVDNTGALIPDPSDAALKTAIEDLHGPLRMVLNMRPVSFLWRDAERYGPQREVGFIAQEMMAAVPEAVSTNAGGTYSLDYSKLVAVVVGAIQELFEDRTWLARRVQELEDRAQKAEDKLAQLEARLLSIENYSGIKGCGNCPQTDDGENPP